MTLALRLGKTLAELRSSMSAAEFVLWQALDAESPISDDRYDLHAAMVASAVFQAQGAKVKVSDMLPNWGGGESEAAQEVADDPFFAALASMAK
ncbi:phage tail assembly protein T [Burkholderia pseudomultivorans]|uniref:phage tail assembly protein T n=1 Tax=Burkholderia pseudomultivorans TaxID=1207504 RepID=UPI00075705A6|nr:phage tail protein [Burkholderia pseudomultivorans]KVC29298.1 phage tail protein [Burkholderia pseudomultivorans]KVC34606.1 phage tail protein [Burkholderia pseudomultivorans]